MGGADEAQLAAEREGGEAEQGGAGALAAPRAVPLLHLQQISNYTSET